MAEKEHFIVVDFSEIDNLIEKKVEKDLLWYDHLKREMLKFKGGQLVFEYRHDDWLEQLPEGDRERLGYKTTYRMLPKVIDLKSKIREKRLNKLEIINWFKDYSRYNRTDIDIVAESDKRVVFRVPEEEYKDFIDELDSNRFKYWEQ
jgi:hypothetical protein